MAILSFSWRRHILGLGLFVLALIGLAAQEIPLGEATYRDLKRTAENNQRVFTDLMAGKVAFDAKNKTQLDAIQAIARYQVYSLAYPPNLVNKVDQGPEALRRIKDSEDYMRGILQSDKSRANTQAMVDAYYTALANNAATVAKSDFLVSRVNAVRLLASVGTALSTRDDATLKGIVEPQVMIKTGDLLLDRVTPILAKAPDDGTRLWGLRALRETLKANQILREGRPAKSLNQAKEAEALKIAAQIVTTPPAFVADSAKGGPEVDAYKIMRREAIRSLANASSPLLPGDFRPIQLLGKCLTENGLNPEPRIDELVEAAAGMVRLAPIDRMDADYVPEYTTYWMGRFLQNYSRIYTENRANPVAWKTQAARLIESLDGFRQRYPRNKFIQEMVVIYLDYLTTIEKGAAEPRPFPNIEEKLEEWRRNPANPKLFFRSKPDSGLPEKMAG